MRPALARAVAAAVALAALAPLPARAFVRTTDRTTGKALSWPLPIVPWHLNRDWPHTSASCQATAGGDPALDAVQAAFAQWQQACTDLRFVYAGPLSEIRTGGGGDGQSVVVFRHGWCSQDPLASVDPCMSDPAADCGSLYGCFDDGPSCIGKTAANPCSEWGVVALTSVLYDPVTGRIMDADIEVNGWDGVVPSPASLGNPPQHGWYFTCWPEVPQPAACGTYGEASCGYMDLQNTLTHEVGHFLGLAHSPSHPEATMFATTNPGETSKRDLAADDVAGVCAIYPVPSGGCGCGGGAAGAASLLVALLALRPLRRRGARR